MKGKLTERDVCTKYITPAIQKAGWDIHKQVREEVTFTKGRIVAKGNVYTRKKSKRADYILYYKPNLPIALIEAKDMTHSIGAGMQQALEYAEILDIPFVFSSNGKGFLFHDRTGKSEPLEQEISLDQFPSPEELWDKYRQWKGLQPVEEKIVTYDYYVDGSGKEPRYYQRIAINRTVEAVAKGQNRILLVMATGTGKTYTAFQIIWRLWKSRTKKRILFLADRNILIDQTKANDFKPFKDKMTKIAHRQVDKSFEIYLSLYQGISGAEEEKNIYKQFSPDFFDLVIVDECHRGSAAEDSAWREILEYFSSATQIGLTATPKETKDVSNIHYFGEPIYTYSLKQGIEDGFLAPYRVIRYTIDKDVEGWRPEKGQRDRYGYEIKDRIYNQKDFDRNLIIDERTKLVAKKVTEYLMKTDRFQKTIIFCVNIDHAERMRQAMMNENADLVSQNRKYVMRITGDDEEGKRELDNFIDPGSTYPVIACTSKLMTTGVDAQTCKLIVLDSNINSMTEFKQIIGRGTRVNEEFGKYSFTILDFRNATRLFADPAFDGPPESVYEPGKNDPILPSEENSEDTKGNNDPEESGSDYPVDTGSAGLINEKPRVYVVDNVQIKVLNERVQYIGEDGKLITESLKDYTKKTVQKEYRSLDEFLRKWNETERKEVIIQELMEQGVLLEALQEEVGKDMDPFDLILHVAFDQKPLTRRERAQNVKKQDYFTKYGEQARKVLEALLEKYADSGIENIESMEVLKLPPFNEYGSVVEIIKLFGGKDRYLQAVNELKQNIYSA